MSARIKLRKTKSIFKKNDEEKVGISIHDYTNMFLHTNSNKNTKNEDFLKNFNFTAT